MTELDTQIPLRICVFVNLVFGPLLSLLNSSLLWLCIWLVPMLFSMPVFGGFPVGPGAACIIYASFSPRISTFWLYSSSYKIHSCCTIGESLCHWNFYGSIPKKEHRNWTGGLASPKKYSLLMPQPNTRLWCSQQLTLLKVPCQAAINMTDPHGNWQFLKEQPPQNERLLYSCIF